MALLHVCVRLLICYCVETIVRIGKLFLPFGRQVSFSAQPMLQTPSAGALYIYIYIYIYIYRVGKNAFFDRNRRISRNFKDIGPWLCITNRGIGFRVTFDDLE